MRDALGFEEVNQEVTSTATISGTNVYATTAVTTPTVNATTALSGLNVYATGSAQADHIIGDVAITNPDGRLESAAIGSPSSFGQSVQAGSATLDGGSEVWAIFGTAFTNIPKVTVSYNDGDPSFGATAGSRVGTGSVLLMGDTASKDVAYIAVG